MGEGRPGGGGCLSSGTHPPPAARPSGGQSGSATHWLWVRHAGVGAQHRPLGSHAVADIAHREGGREVARGRAPIALVRCVCGQALTLPRPPVLPNIGCFAFGAIRKYQLDVSTDAKAQRKATLCGWPCSTFALDKVKALAHQRIHDVSEEEKRRIAKSRCQGQYNHSPSQGLFPCDDNVDDPVLDRLEDESYFVEGEES